jgi:alkanesulfonate monooxygenase
MKKYWTERKFDHEGKFYRVEGCRPLVKCASEPYPPLYAGGASTPAEDLFAREIDTYLLWGESTPQMKERIARMREKAAAHGRELRFGVRFHVLSRDTHAEAVEAAESQLEGVTPEQIERTQAVLNATDSAGESRQRAFVSPSENPSPNADLWVEDNLWAGVGQVRRGIGVTVLGSHEEVARKFLSFVDMGMSFFILSGYPHLEEAENAGKTWMPLFYEMLRERSASLAAG